MYLTVVIAFLGGQLFAQSTVKSTTDSQANTTTTNVATATTTTNGSKAVDLYGFPVYVSTGNIEQDNANYQTAKENWIKENQALYNEYLASVSNSSTKAQLSDLPGFPVYINSGNVELDRQNYANAKQLWIENNKELYDNFKKRSNSNSNNTRRSSTK